MASNEERGEVVVLVVEAGEALRNAKHPDRRFYDEFGLSARERQIVDLLLEGYQYKEIAWKLSIRLPTVRTHLQRVYRKTGVHAKHELLAKAKALVAPRGGKAGPGERRLLSLHERS
jgi:DNA-binding CsgD family transcriptional regulator